VGQAAPIKTISATPAEHSPCRTCGACCSFGSDWPRFSTEEDSHLDRIPSAFVAANRSGMRCEGDRCSALSGTVGVATSCSVYDLRPDVCRACEPGDEACAMARQRFGLNVLAV